jgi:hypothetical protein
MATAKAGATIDKEAINVIIFLIIVAFLLIFLQISIYRV